MLMDINNIASYPGIFLFLFFLGRGGGGGGGGGGNRAWYTLLAHVPDFTGYHKIGYYRYTIRVTAWVST